MRSRWMNMVGAIDEGDHSCWGEWDTSLSHNNGCLQAIVAGFRQTDDLLSAVGADVRWHPRHSRDFDTAGSATIPSTVGRWLRSGPPVLLCYSRSASRASRRLHRRAEVHRDGSGRADPWR